MALLQIKSENPKLSYILYKNPSTGMIIRSIKNGKTFAYYTKDNDLEFNIYFKDDYKENSFSHNNNEFSFNDTTQYNSPIFIYSVINEYFQHLLNNDIKEDIENNYNNELHINMINLNNIRFLEYMEKHYEGINFIYQPINHNNYKVIISTNKSIRILILVTYIFSILYTFVNYRDFYFEESHITKILKVLNKINTPYYIKYLVKSRIIKRKKTFEASLGLLNSNNEIPVEFTFGDTSESRRNFLLNNIDLNNEIIDVGCSEMRTYGMTLAFLLNKNLKQYHAIDINEDILKEVERKKDLKKLDNIETYPSIELYNELQTNSFNKTVILSEVIEHMKVNNAIKLVKTILNKTYWDKIIITTPNSEFNQYYILDTDNGFRHPDHDFEFTKKEFNDFINKIVNKNNYNITYHLVGDIVNGISPTQSVIITKK